MADEPFCGCDYCARAGAPIAGHCVDIDGDYWHSCPAVAPSATTEEPTP